MKVKRLLLTLLVTLLSLSTITFGKTFSFQNEEKSIIHSSNYFKVQEGTLNFIVNSIYEDSNNIYLDAYIFNTTDSNINAISDFNLSMFDKNNTLIFTNLFSSISLQYTLEKYEGERVLLPVEKKICNFTGKDLTSLIWRFTYKFR